MSFKSSCFSLLTDKLTGMQHHSQLPWPQFLYAVLDSFELVLWSAVTLNSRLYHLSAGIAGMSTCHCCFQSFNLFLKDLFTFYFYVNECFAYVCTHLCSTCAGQKRVSEPLKLELQLWANILVLGTEPGPSASAVSSINLPAIFSAPITAF